eukprot:5122497-Alexandrium_andersonii.AAC.1
MYAVAYCKLCGALLWQPAVATRIRVIVCATGACSSAATVALWHCVVSYFSRRVFSSLADLVQHYTLPFGRCAVTHITHCVTHHA